MNQYTNRMQLLKWLTVVSFLLIIIAYEKISAFMFMFLVLAPLYILSGDAGISFGGLPDIFWKIIFIASTILVYVSLGYLVKTAGKPFQSIKSKYYTYLSVGVLFAPAIVICFNKNNGIGEFILLGIFFLFAVVTCLVTYLTKIVALEEDLV
ncbi:hypothetical protein [Pedobacter sp. MW01-1-1]|uniref:hypothetical protein n=1 Tax=Pedobacter sp. MW01-1-1 TaxID=3383027 RepID=UPI003FEE85CB